MNQALNQIQRKKHCWVSIWWDGTKYGSDGKLPQPRMKKDTKGAWLCLKTCLKSKIYQISPCFWSKVCNYNIRALKSQLAKFLSTIYIIVNKWGFQIACKVCFVILSLKKNGVVTGDSWVPKYTGTYKSTAKQRINCDITDRFWLIMWKWFSIFIYVNRHPHLMGDSKLYHSHIGILRSDFRLFCNFF